MTMKTHAEELRSRHEMALGAYKRTVARWDMSDPDMLIYALNKLEGHLIDVVQSNQAPVEHNSSKEFQEAQSELVAKAMAMVVEMDCARGNDLLVAIDFLRDRVDDTRMDEVL
jgi:hypothetical protein